MANRTQPNRLKELANQQSTTVLELVKRTIIAEGSKLAAARKLGVSPAAIDYHLTKANLTIETVQILTFKEGCEEGT